MRFRTRMTALTLAAAALLYAGAASAAEPPPIPDSDKSDYVVIYASHAQAKPSDPVSIRFQKIKVTKVKFTQPVKDGLNGASAEFQIDVASLKSDSDKRDQHLKSPDYLNASKFSTITVSVGNPRASGDGTYRAPAKVAFQGKTYDWEVAFKVVETLPDGVRIRGEHKLTRKDVAVGKESGDSVGQDILVRLQLTLKKQGK